jgi:DNA repair photolyase
MSSQLDLFGAPSPVINPDGSVKGSKVIYAPKGPAGEYAAPATNPYDGCGHGCDYPCYVTEAGFTRLTREQFNAGAVLRPNFIANLRADAAAYQAVGITEQVTMTFTSDPYHPGDTQPTRTAIETLIEHGLGVCVLTKGGRRPLRDLNLFRHDRDAFAVTLISLDDDFCRKWEPKAPLPGARIAGLKRFHEAGIFTWVSAEPVLDPEATLAMVEATYPFVRLFKIGKVNYSRLAQTIDWHDFTRLMLDLLNRVGAGAYFKRDLQPFLPPGYPNPMRVPQHHGGGAR